MLAQIGQRRALGLRPWADRAAVCDADLFGHDLGDEIFERLGANLAQHLGRFGIAGANVAADEIGAGFKFGKGWRASSVERSLKRGDEFVVGGLVHEISEFAQDC